MSRGSIIGPVLFKVGEDVMIDASLRAVQIPHDIHLVDHIKLKKPVSFVLVVEKLNIKKGKYLALLTHSGSRGFGATIAGHYTKLAKEICKLPKEAANLARTIFSD